MLHLPMTTLRHLALPEPTSPRNAFPPGAPGLIMRDNPRRMTSLQNYTPQVPWNHILAQNTGGWGVCPYQFRAGCHPKAAMFAMPAPSVRIANGSYCGRRCNSTGVQANLTPELYSPSAVWSLQFNENRLRSAAQDQPHIGVPGMNTLLSILLFTSLSAAEPQTSPSVPMTTSNLNNVLYVDGTRFNGAPDLGKTLNAMIAFLPKVRGYPAGKIVIPPGSYAQSTTVVINSPYVSFYGAGSGSTIVNCSVPTGDCFLFVDTPFTVTNGTGGMFGLTLNGNAAPAQKLIHTRDMTIGFHLWDVVLGRASGAGSICWWAENYAHWTERTNLNDVWFNNCTTGLSLTVNSEAGGSNSFGHQSWTDVRWNLNRSQTAMQLSDTALLYASILSGVVNSDAGPNVAFSLAGTSQVTSDVWLNLLIDAGDRSGTVGVSSAVGTGFAPSGTFQGMASNHALGGFYTSAQQGASNIWMFPPNNLVGLTNVGPTGVGSWLHASVGSGGHFYLGLGENLHFDGSYYKTAGDGVNNGATAIFSSTGNGLRFYTVPSTGASAQTISAATLDSSYLRATLDQSGLNLKTGIVEPLSTKSSDYTLTVSDSWINVRGMTTITVPHSATGQRWVIFNCGGTTSGARSGDTWVTIRADRGKVNSADSIRLPTNTGKECTADGTNVWCR